MKEKFVIKCVHSGRYWGNRTNEWLPYIYLNGKFCYLFDSYKEAQDLIGIIPKMNIPFYGVYQIEKIFIL